MNKTHLKLISEEKIRSLILKKFRDIYIPSSVYRIQLNREFTFQKAKAIIPYLKELGIEAVYCSPFFQASPGSMHGYNVTNPNLINQEIGTWEDYSDFCNILSENSMGQIADIVPNHMGINGNNNPWWQDVLENGETSIYSDYFDINWSPVKKELTHKILIPVLGDFYGNILENQEIRLNYRKGNFFINYYEHEFPVDPKTYPLILEDTDKNLMNETGSDHSDYLELLSIKTAFQNLPFAYEIVNEKKQERNREKEIAKQRLNTLALHSESIRKFIEQRLALLNGNKRDAKSFDLLDNLLNLQPYRLCYWSVASQEINYRRFFDINELAALRIEDEKVFRQYHTLLFQLIHDNKIQGLRIDHPDGLYDPPVYFKRLQREYLLQMILKELQIEPGLLDIEAIKDTLERLLTNEFHLTPPLYILAEKILERDEHLPENWMIHGTVGYDFMNVLNGLYVDRKNENKFAKLYENFIGHPIDYENLVYDKKKFFGLIPMASEINELGHRLDLISETNRNYRDFTRTELTVAIREVIAGFPVYRTYVSPEGLKITERDKKNIHTAITKAKEKTPLLNHAVYDFLEHVLLLKLKIEPGSEEMKLYKDFLMRFQQLSGPIMAKGVEDTSFYVFNRLISLNEVGGDPFTFGYEVQEFHAQNITRNKRWPSSMLSTSTHDTKRSEDLRMRINVLSELPEEWETKINDWAKMNKKYKTLIHHTAEPRPNTEYFIYQTLIGAWPDDTDGTIVSEDFVERIGLYILKSIREAKIYTNWVKPNTNYEKVVDSFIRGLLKNEEFLKSFIPFQKKISLIGKLNSLSATAIKIASPGVVDVYQGNETWNYCLVDPDNRRPVDFKARESLLNEIRASEGKMNQDLQCSKFDYTMKGLFFRRKYKELFVGGEYIPVEVTGARKNNVVAFIRRHGKHIALLAALRFFADFNIREDFILRPDFWQDTGLLIPKGIELPLKLRDVLHEEIIPVKSSQDDTPIKASDLFYNHCARILTDLEG